jgi:hypothetical protein
VHYRSGSVTQADFHEMISRWRPLYIGQGFIYLGRFSWNDISADLYISAKISADRECVKRRVRMRYTFWRIESCLWEVGRSWSKLVEVGRSWSYNAIKMKCHSFLWIAFNVSLPILRKSTGPRILVFVFLCSYFCVRIFVFVLTKSLGCWKKRSANATGR